MIKGLRRKLKLLDDSYFIDNGVKNIMEKTQYGTIKYKMPYLLADEILADKIVEGKKKNDWQKILCEYVNEKYNLLGECVEVILY